MARVLLLSISAKRGCSRFTKTSQRGNGLGKIVSLFYALSMMKRLQAAPFISARMLSTVMDAKRMEGLWM
jgi:hypothetical protein